MTDPFLRLAQSKYQDHLPCYLQSLPLCHHRSLRQKQYLKYLHEGVDHAQSHHGPFPPIQSHIDSVAEYHVHHDYQYNQSCYHRLKLPSEKRGYHWRVHQLESQLITYLLSLLILLIALLCNNDTTHQNHP